MLHNYLERIVAHKKQEISDLYALLENDKHHPIHAMLQGKKYDISQSFVDALKAPGLSVIAEVKRKSPSKGDLALIQDPMRLAQSYVEGGARAISVLTDQAFFGGSVEDIKQISACGTPILRKDFILDVIQIAESIHMGAHAVLGIVAVLGKQLPRFLQAASQMGIPMLVEVHNAEELDIALESGARVVGINNRDLHDFTIDTNRAFELLRLIPKGVISVAESGVLQPSLATDYYAAGFDGVLIGEGLVRCPDPTRFIKEICCV